MPNFNFLNNKQMRIYLAAIIFLLLAGGCKNKKTLSGNEHVEAEEFFEAYNELKLPFTVSDTSLKNIADTNTISYSIFTQFIPDSVFNTPFGKDRQITIQPIGKIEQKGKETYFASLVSSKSRSAVYLSVYDKNKFTTNIPLLISNDDEIIHSASIDKKLTIVINEEWTVKNDIYYDRTIYAYNNVGIFTTVLTETNADRSSEAVIVNPLDTFPKKYKYSGDYTKGTKNLLFIRDGNLPNEYRFFVHFTNDNKEDPCGGELKGIFTMTSEKSGVFTGKYDPCVIDFNFSNNQVQVKETGSCGNYRGIKCFFNDSFAKKKEKVQPKKK